MSNNNLALPTSVQRSKELLKAFKEGKVYSQFQIIEDIGGNNEENWKLYYGDDWKEFRQKELEAHRRFKKEGIPRWIEALEVHIILLEQSGHPALVRIYPKGPVDDTGIDTAGKN